MPRFKLTVEYDGTDFCGFQYQVGQRSVQDELERALLRLTKQSIRIQGAGRTDTGVHALGQVISFQADTRIPVEKMAHAFNSVLPRDVSVREAQQVDERFHARFSAVSRAYVYLVLNRTYRSAVFDRYAWHYPYALDLDAMRAGAAQLLGTRDFRAWANETTETRTTVRTLHRFVIRPHRAFVMVYVEANAFLRGQVRNMVGTLVEVGGGKRNVDDISRITQSGERAMAGASAPARGLTLVRVRYERAAQAPDRD